MIRKACLRGTWYPYDKKGNEEITGELKSHGNEKAAVLPHAGLIFSGEIIRAFFSIVPENATKAIILSPSHYYRLQRNVIYTSDFTSSETPFGNVETIRLEIPGAEINDDVIAKEHGLEMFLPFIGKLGLKVSYGVISALGNAADAAAIATRLLPIIDDETILIASSDFTHYGKRFGYTPYPANAVGETIRHDRKCSEMLADGKGQEAYMEFRNSTICGIAPAAIAAETAAILGYDGSIGPSSTSVDITGDSDDFVSYQSVIWRKND